MKFNRLSEMKKKLDLSRRLDQAAKTERRLLLGTLRNALELTGTLSSATTGIMYQLAKFIEEHDLNTYDLADEWLSNLPRQKSLSPAQRPKMFYRYIKFERLNTEEQTIRMVYLETLKRFTSSRLSISMKEFKDLNFTGKLDEWFGKRVGNSIEGVLIDFLVVVFSEASKFNKLLLHKPKTILGPFGWRTFDAWVEENYGGINGYATPTKEEFTKTSKKRSELIELAKVRYQALEKGEIKEFDRLGEQMWES